MLALISATKVSRISAGSVVHSFISWRGPMAAITVTDDMSGSPPRRSRPSGSQGAPPSSSSARQ